MKLGAARYRRLAEAQLWIRTYEGKNLVRAYRKRFNVTRLCALIELQVLGLPITGDAIEAARLEAGQTQEACARQKARTNCVYAANNVLNGFQGSTFAYIAGYTAAGFPYGITWEEMEAADLREGHEGSSPLDDHPF